MRVTLTDARAVSTYNETVVRLYVHTLGGTCCTHACISCKCCTYMYLLQVFHHMHVPLASVAHACTCDETVVRPGFEEELPPSSPLQATHKNFHRLLHHHQCGCSLSFIFFESFIFPSADPCIFLCCTIATSIFPEIVFNCASNVLHLNFLSLSP